MSIFDGELVRLTHIERDSLPAFMRWFRDYEIQSLLDVNVIMPVTDEAEQDYYDHVTRKSDDEFHFSVRTLEEDRLIGNCSLFGINHKNRSADFGIVIGEKEFWGRGYGSDATRVILQFAFREVNLNRVQLEVFDYNTRAIRAYEKVGFVREGVRREAVFRAGRYHDVIVMAALREAWTSG